MNINVNEFGQMVDLTTGQIIDDDCFECEASAKPLNLKAKYIKEIQKKIDNKEIDKE